MSLDVRTSTKRAGTQHESPSPFNKNEPITSYNFFKEQISGPMQRQSSIDLKISRTSSGKDGHDHLTSSCNHQEFLLYSANGSSCSANNTVVKSTSSLFNRYSNLIPDDALSGCPFDQFMLKSLTDSTPKLLTYDAKLDSYLNPDSDYDGPNTVTRKPTSEFVDFHTPKVAKKSGIRELYGIVNLPRSFSDLELLRTLRNSSSIPTSNTLILEHDSLSRTPRNLTEQISQADSSTHINNLFGLEQSTCELPEVFLEQPIPTVRRLKPNRTTESEKSLKSAGESNELSHENKTIYLLSIAIPSASMGLLPDDGALNILEEHSGTNQSDIRNNQGVSKPRPSSAGYNTRSETWDATVDQSKPQPIFTGPLYTLTDVDIISPYMVSNFELESPLFTQVVKSTYLRQIPKWTKSNSTSSLYIMCTPCRSELRDMSTLVCYGIHDMILDSHRSRSFRTHEIFSEDLYPLRKGISLSHPCNPPRFHDVFTFFFSIVDAAQLGSEICIITLVYLDRLLYSSRYNIYSANWPRMILAALLLAAKVWDDQAVWNVDFCTIFPDLKVSETNHLERVLMEAMYFNVNVKGSTFAKYYFSLTDRFGSRISRPMSVREAVHLQAYPNTSVRPTSSSSSCIPEMRLNGPAVSAKAFDTADIYLEQMNPENLAAPASLEGVVPEVPIGVTQVKLTGIRRVCSDYLVVNRVPASIM